ncbi:ef hand domain-containing protein [Cystoisospora suis]|uniref:Ef hand domain-containing protein n=1 Tax=Cystoisospora suis TaxID=483139 RepID=A0A2C6LHE3_9APIC|nr:ef hand domain-containing protein [Cystoisospora suis]
MAFDSIEEFFERRGMTSLTKMLRGAYKELTILGFISLTLFAVVRSGQMQRVNDKYLGVSHTELAAIHEAEEAGEATPPPTHLTEIFEEIHILIFVVMSIFLLSACILTARGYRLHRKHEYLDAKTETDLRNDVTMLEREGGVSEQHVEESLTYWGIRQRFLKPRIPTIPKPRARYGELPDFSFAAYISHAYGDTLTEMVELPPSILVLSFLIVLLLRPALDLAGREVIAFMILVAFALLGMTLLAYSYVRHVTGILDPDPKKLRSVFGAARVSAEQLQEALDAPVDRRWECLNSSRCPSVL